MDHPQTIVTPTAFLSGIPQRVDAIDVLRAITMVLMIFVNDLWSLTNIPLWLEHVPEGVDGMGLADAVFPAFLFIVGMSLPFAVNNRRQKGDTDAALLSHVISRSVALLVMGVFLVNGEYLNEAATNMQRVTWNLLSCTAFILIWNAYPKAANKWAVYAGKGLGVFMLGVLAIVYRGGEGVLTRFETHWWGILGLIGWSYFAAALVTVFSRNRIPVLLLAWTGFAVLSIMSHAGLLPSIIQIIPGAISGGTLVGLTMGGVVIATLFLEYRKRADNKRMTGIFIAIALLLIGLAIYTRQFWGLSKLGATPAWLFLCSALTILSFTAIYWLTDVGGKAGWFSFIKPAGTDTLLCYLIPYFAYAGMALLPLQLPELVLIGGIGLLKSFLFAVLCAWFTGRLNRIGVRLKL